MSDSSSQTQMVVDHAEKILRDFEILRNKYISELAKLKITDQKVIEILEQHQAEIISLELNVRVLMAQTGLMDRISQHPSHITPTRITDGELPVRVTISKRELEVILSKATDNVITKIKKDIRESMSKPFIAGARFLNNLDDGGKLLLGYWVFSIATALWVINRK